MVSVRKESITKCEEPEEEEVEEEEEEVLQRAAAAAAPWLCHQWVPTELLCQRGCCFPQNAGKPPGKGGAPPAHHRHPPRPQGSSFESPAASPGASARMITSESPLPTSGATFWFRFSASVHWFSLLWQFPEPSATAVPAV